MNTKLRRAGPLFYVQDAGSSNFPRGSIISVRGGEVWHPEGHVIRDLTEEEQVTISEVEVVGHLGEILTPPVPADNSLTLRRIGSCVLVESAGGTKLPTRALISPRGRDLWELSGVLLRKLTAQECALVAHAPIVGHVGEIIRSQKEGRLGRIVSFFLPRVSPAQG